MSKPNCCIKCNKFVPEGKRFKCLVCRQLFCPIHKNHPNLHKNENFEIVYDFSDSEGDLSQPVLVRHERMNNLYVDKKAGNISLDKITELEKRLAYYKRENIKLNNQLKSTNSEILEAMNEYNEERELHRKNEDSMKDYIKLLEARLEDYHKSYKKYSAEIDKELQSIEHKIDNADELIKKKPNTTSRNEKHLRKELKPTKNKTPAGKKSSATSKRTNGKSSATLGAQSRFLSSKIPKPKPERRGRPKKNN